MVSIVDNFLTFQESNDLRSYMLTDAGFPWYYSDAIDYVLRPPLDTFQFDHIFYHPHTMITSRHTKALIPILDKICPVAVYRIKANLIARTTNIIENSFHTDIGDLVDSPKEKMEKWTTSIYYVNTNNGYTKFEDGTVVESVANRFITFPSNLQHTGTSCSDEKVRIVINFNYFST